MAREVTSGAQLRNVLHSVSKVLQRGDIVIINQVPIKDTYAEAFDFLATRVIITADTLEWAMEAARAAVGFGASIIGCGAECGIEGEVKDTPDGRPGVSILVFARTPEDLDGQLQGRVGMCVPDMSHHSRLQWTYEREDGGHRRLSSPLRRFL